MPVAVADTFGFLLGEWRLVRRFRDARSGVVGVLDGHACLTQSDHGSSTCCRRALYSEVGKLCLGGLGVPARRTLGVCSVDAETAELFLSNGQPYIDLDLRRGSCHRVHMCGADMYAITVSTISSDSLSIHWDVSGPQKRYEAVTRLTRCS